MSRPKREVNGSRHLGGAEQSTVRPPQREHPISHADDEPFDFDWSPPDESGARRAARTTHQSRRNPLATWGGTGVPVFRVIIGIGAMIALAINYWTVQGDVESARISGASAIQIIQIWTPHLYYGVMIIGIAIALYIVSRGLE